MYTKIFTFTTLLLLLFGLMGLPSKIFHLLYLILPIISYLFASKFELIPKNIYLNYHCILYFFWLLKEILLSSWCVVKIIWSKDLNLQPILKKISHEQNHNGNIVLYANSITLTPGTVTLDISDNILVIHVLESASIASVKSMGNRVRFLEPKRTG